MQHGHYGLQSGDTSAGVSLYRNAATVVLYSDLPPLTERDLHAVAGARYGLINAVIYDFEDKMVEAATVCASDVHTGASADRL